MPGVAPQVWKPVTSESSAEKWICSRLERSCSTVRSMMLVERTRPWYSAMVAFSQASMAPSIIAGSLSSGAMSASEMISGVGMASTLESSGAIVKH